MEDPLTADDPVRGGVAAEEDEARAYAEQYLAPASVTVSVKPQRTVNTKVPSDLHASNDGPCICHVVLSRCHMSAAPRNGSMIPTATPTTASSSCHTVYPATHLIFCWCIEPFSGMFSCFIVVGLLTAAQQAPDRLDAVDCAGSASPCRGAAAGECVAPSQRRSSLLGCTIFHSTRGRSNCLCCVCRRSSPRGWPQRY